MSRSRRLVLLLLLALAAPSAVLAQGDELDPLTEPKARVSAAMQLTPDPQRNCPGPFAVDAVFRQPDPSGVYTEMVMVFAPGNRQVSDLVATDPLVIYEARSDDFDGYLLLDARQLTEGRLDGHWVETRERGLPQARVQRWVNESDVDQGGVWLRQPVRRDLRGRGACVMTVDGEAASDLRASEWYTEPPGEEPDTRGAALTVELDDWGFPPAADGDTTGQRVPDSVSPSSRDASLDTGIWGYVLGDDGTVTRRPADERALELQDIPATADFFTFDVTSAPVELDTPAGWFVRPVDTGEIPVDRSAGTPVPLQAFRDTEGGWSWIRQAVVMPQEGVTDQLLLDALERALTQLGGPEGSEVDPGLADAIERLAAWDFTTPSGVPAAAGQTVYVVGEIPGPGDLYGFAGGVFVDSERTPVAGGRYELEAHVEVVESFGGAPTEVSADAKLGGTGWPPASAQLDGTDFAIEGECPGDGPVVVWQHVRIEGAGETFPVFVTPPLDPLHEGARTDVYLPIVICD